MRTVKFPIRQEIEVLPGDPVIGPYDIITINSSGRINENQGRNLVLGWKITETVGIMASNARGITKTSVTRN